MNAPHTEYYQLIKQVQHCDLPANIIEYCQKYKWFRIVDSDKTLCQINYGQFIGQMLCGIDCKPDQYYYIILSKDGIIDFMKTELNNVANLLVQKYDKSYTYSEPGIELSKRKDIKPDPEFNTTSIVKRLQVKKQNKTMQEKIEKFKQQIISEKELMEGVTEKDNVFYYQGVAVFCNCLFGRKCKFCDDKDVQDEEAVQVLIDLTVQGVLDQYVQIIFHELGQDTRKKAIQIEYYAKCSYLKKMLLQDISIIVFDKQVKKKDTIEYLTHVSTLTLYKHESLYYDLVFDNDIYLKLQEKVSENIQEFLIQQNNVKGIELDDMVDEFYEYVKKVLLRNLDQKGTEVDQDAVDADEDVNDQQAMADAMEGSDET